MLIPVEFRASTSAGGEGTPLGAPVGLGRVLTRHGLAAPIQFWALHNRATALASACQPQATLTHRSRSPAHVADPLRM